MSEESLTSKSISLVSTAFIEQQRSCVHSDNVVCHGEKTAARFTCCFLYSPTYPNSNTAHFRQSPCHSCMDASPIFLCQHRAVSEWAGDDVSTFFPIGEAVRRSWSE